MLVRWLRLSMPIAELQLLFLSVRERREPFTPHTCFSAPTCLEMAIYNNVTGELVCSQKPIYGGTGKIDIAKFDEPGYILQPPCLWGDQPGLEPMPKASGVKFLIKAITNSTYGHHGWRSPR